jgi:hypothetical protein
VGPFALGDQGRSAVCANFIGPEWNIPDAGVVGGYRYYINLAYFNTSWDFVDDTENYYDAFAQPEAWSSTDRRAFAMTQAGIVYANTGVDGAVMWADPGMDSLFNPDNAATCAFQNDFRSNQGVPQAFMVPKR